MEWNSEIKYKALLLLIIEVEIDYRQYLGICMTLEQRMALVIFLVMLR